MGNPVNLLVVEDNPADSDLIREYLSEITEFESNLNCVSTLRDAKGYLQGNQVHVVLIDLSLPDSRGIETVKSVMDLLHSAPAIVLTSLDDTALALKAIESGAQDYLLKGAMNSDVLARVIRHSLQRSKWMSKLAEVQNQFYRSQKMESIGRIASGIAHDFNNQLGSISLLTSLAAEELPEGHSAATHLERILEVSDRAAELVKQLMVFCRQNASQPKVFDLHAMLRRCEVLFRKLMGASVQLEVVGTPGAMIHGDPGLIEQAITNLVINARDAMNDGGRLTLQTLIEKSNNGNDRVVLSVKDTGCGIPKDLCDKIFEPFFTTKEVGKGTGLGLSMVYGTVTQSGGSIAVDSEVGKGTRFVLTFPLRKEQEAPNTGKGEKIKMGTGQTILLVDDEDILRDAIAKHLGRHGYNVVQAGDGVEALAKLKELEQVAILVTDMVMPNMNGGELAKHVKQINPDLQVIYMSGYSVETSSGGTDAEGVTYLPKPFTPAQLFEKIQRLIAS